MNQDTEDRIRIARDFNLSLDILDLLCGDFIGEGQTRRVYNCNLVKGYVVKIEKEAGSHDNLLEYYFYNAVKYQPEIVKWLAPTSWISNNGRVLLQKKASLITPENKKRIPDKVPDWMTDMKYSNYGFIGKQFVCFDYAFSADIAMSNYPSKAKMKKFVSHLKE